MKTKEKKGFSLHRTPKSYSLLPQQQRFKEVVKECGIRKGIKKEELQKLMKECVGPKLRKDVK